MMLLTEPRLPKDAVYREQAIYRVAQWAINSVDFRDSDAIMSPFEFDLDPFNGWQPMDGDVKTDEGGDRRVVWGCEYPELIITETLAWHDRRVRDTDDDDGTGKFRGVATPSGVREGDPNLDQFRIPQGSLFVELYCTRGVRTVATSDRGPAELYDPDDALDLGRMAPSDGESPSSPVWRMVVSPVSGARHARDRSGEPLELPDASIERILWITNRDPAGHIHEDKIYFSRDVVESPKLGRGQYTVIGSRVIPGPESQTGRLIVAAAKPPRTWESSTVSAPGGIAISISEPLPQADYYMEPDDAVGHVTTSDGKIPDVPFDDAVQANLPLRPLAREDVPSQGTVIDFRTVYLQRLANPLQPHDPTGNPYLTVDWETIDLTIFNSEDRALDSFPESTLGPFDRSFSGLGSMPMHYASRESGNAGGNIWETGAAPLPEPDSTDVSTLVQRGPIHSLGRLNRSLLLPGEEPLASETPPLPYPWLTWNNRPYISQYELLLVPRSFSAILTDEFKLGGHFGPIGHLLDFVEMAHEPVPFSRILDYVEVPSAFVGTREWLTPNSANKDADLPALRPPLNWWSRCRDPGRININTIYEPLVWKGIAKGFPPMDSEEFWSRVVRSREGYAGSPAHQFPTRMANPFRSSASADLMPLDPLQRHGRQATLLRSDPQDDDVLLFSARPDQHPEVVKPHRNQNRHAYFYYQGLVRLGNLLTTRSNVFAIWITVGYFEVEPHDIDAAHPDGYALGQELGADTGEIRRHRAFYIVDRSIPVAFVPGQNHNVDRGILLRRFIE